MHVYFYIFLPIAENSRFWDELSLFSLSSMIIMIFGHDLDAWVIIPRLNSIVSRMIMLKESNDQFIFGFFSKNLIF